MKLKSAPASRGSYTVFSLQISRLESVVSLLEGIPANVSVSLSEN